MESTETVVRRRNGNGQVKIDTKLPALRNRAERALRSTTDITCVTPEMFKEWKDPEFQRPLRVNAKVQAMVQRINLDGVIPDTITVGILKNERFLIDGQHRREAYLIASAAEPTREVFAEIRYMYFDSMAEMGRKYVELNSSLVKQRPDDILRGMEGTSRALQLIRNRCKFIGYDMIRRSLTSPILGMSVLLRCWYGSAAETPSQSSVSAMEIADTFREEEAAQCCEFAQLAERAWGREPEYKRLWGAMNLTLCMWLFRRLVLEPTPEVTKLTKDQFRLCLTGLSAAGDYIDWILDRKMNERDRAPCYNRIKKIFSARLRAEGIRSVKLPAPPWTLST